MLSKILICCALFVAAQAGYASSGSSYGGHRSGGSSVAGIAVQLQPAATLTVLPSAAGSYGGSSGGYGAAPAVSYGAAPAASYGGSHGVASIAIPVSSVSGARGVDGEALRLANIVWALPSPGGPSSALLNVPQFHTTAYTAPAVVIASGSPRGAVSGASAAIAASNVKTASSGYGPAPASVASAGYGSAGSGYGAAPAASGY
ncbi:chorion protein 18 [Cochliomyia hominivorax]